MVDKTESRLKILGFVGSVIVGISGAAVGTWKTLKEVDKIHADDPKPETESEQQPAVTEENK